MPGKIHQNEKGSLSDKDVELTGDNNTLEPCQEKTYCPGGVTRSDSTLSSELQRLTRISKIGTLHVSLLHYLNHEHQRYRSDCTIVQSILYLCCTVGSAPLLSIHKNGGFS